MLFQVIYDGDDESCVFSIILHVMYTRTPSLNLVNVWRGGEFYVILSICGYYLPVDKVLRMIFTLIMYGVAKYSVDFFDRIELQGLWQVLGSCLIDR